MTTPRTRKPRTKQGAAAPADLAQNLADSLGVALPAPAAPEAPQGAVIVDVAAALDAARIPRGSETRRAALGPSDDPFANPAPPAPQDAQAAPAAPDPAAPAVPAQAAPAAPEPAPATPLAAPAQAEGFDNARALAMHAPWGQLPGHAIAGAAPAPAPASTARLDRALTEQSESSIEQTSRDARPVDTESPHYVPLPADGRRRNAYLSYSRLSCFEQCPAAYRHRYIEKRKGDADMSALQLGKTVHAVCEVLVREHMESEQEGPLSAERGLEILKTAAPANELVGIGAYQEASDMVRSFVRMQGMLDGRDVLAIEKEFRIPVGRFEVLGFIDRIDLVSPDTIEIIDYKTNRLLFSREEVDESLQMSLYEVAARRMWPWVRNVKLKFWMLRHDTFQNTTRTRTQLEDALAYTEALGEQTESATMFPERLNLNCCYCEHRNVCTAYQHVLTSGGRPDVVASPEDLEAVAKERQHVATAAKILYARKDELEDILKAQLRDRDELVLAGTRYRMFTATGTKHELGRVVTTLANALATSETEVAKAVGHVENKRLDALLKKAEKQLGKSKADLLRLELDAHAEKTVTSRFWAKEI